jgi:hypothetical protein
MDGELVARNMPMHLNLGDSLSNWESVIGWADIARDPETGLYKIEIRLDERSSDMLEKMVDVFDLKAIGFAGIKKRPETEST